MFTLLHSFLTFIPHSRIVTSSHSTNLESTNEFTNVTQTFVTSQVVILTICLVDQELSHSAPATPVFTAHNTNSNSTASPATPTTQAAPSTPLSIPGSSIRTSSSPSSSPPKPSPPTTPTSSSSTVPVIQIDAAEEEDKGEEKKDIRLSLDVGSAQGGSGTPPLSPKSGAKSPIVDRKTELGTKFDDKNFDLLLKYIFHFLKDVVFFIEL
jgi:hypothetical protein